MSRDLDDYKSVAKDREKLRARKGAYKLEQGDNTIRILKTPSGKRSTAVIYIFSMHENVGPKDKLRYMRCGIDPITRKGSCWLCQKQIPKLEKNGKESRADALRAKPRTVVNIATLSDDGEWAGPFLFYPSAKVGDSITTLLGSKRKDYVDHKRGYNLGITRKGTGLDTKYGPLETDDDSSKVPSKITEQLKPFDEDPDIQKYSEDKQQDAYFGRDGDDSKKSSKRGKEDDEDEMDSDDTDGIEEDDDEEDEKLTKKKKSKSKSKRRDDDDEEDEDDEDDEDEDEDEDEDDEEEEERPRKKSKKRR